MAHHREEGTLGAVGGLGSLDRLLQLDFLADALGHVAEAEDLALQLAIDVQRNAVALEVATVQQGQGDKLAGVVAGMLGQLDHGLQAGLQLAVEEGQDRGIDTRHQQRLGNLPHAREVPVHVADAAVQAGDQDALGGGFEGGGQQRGGVFQRLVHRLLRRGIAEAQQQQGVLAHGHLPQAFFHAEQ